MPKIARNKFELVESISWYIQFLQRALENKGADIGELELFRKQKSRSLNATAALKELELEKRRAELVTREDADKFFAEFQRMVRARISTVPASLAKELRGETSQVMVQAKIERALEAALTLLATIDGPESAKNLA